MMAATRSKKNVSEKLPENEIISRAEKVLKNRKQRMESENWRKQKVSPRVDEEVEEIPYVKVKPLPVVTREEGPVIEEREQSRAYKNKAPLQDDDRGISLLKEALRTPVNVTTEDLLNISHTARQELKKLLTRKRVEKQTCLIEKEVEEDVIRVEQLPCASYVVLTEEKGGLPKGSVVIGDPIEQYLGALQPGEKPKKVVAAQESLGLRAVYPFINGEGRVESLLDGGSQIVSMAMETAVGLKIAWDPGIIVEMESANKALEKTLGMARNVPLAFGHINVYLQVHILKAPAYRVLLGRPFDCVTESLVKNERDGSQLLTLTDPNTGKRSAMKTYERGKQPELMEMALETDFQFSMN
jgi:hypothetical protein